MDWTAYQDKVLAMISKWGAVISLQITTLATNATYSVTGDSFSGATTSVYPTKALFTSRDDRDEQGQPIVIENAVLLVPAKGLPLINEEARVEIIWGSKTLIPLGINTLQPGGEPLFYRMVLK